MQTPVTFIVAFVIVLALIGLVTWLIRRFAGNRLGASTSRGRMPRLAVIDAAAVDGRRRLVLVRRDNVEHLLMIGGPTDIVVEPNIVRAQREAAPRPPLGADLPPRATPFPEVDEAFEPAEPAIVPEPPPARPPRTPFPDDGRRASPAMTERRAPEPLPSFVPEPLTRPEPRADHRIEPRGEPREPPPMRPIPREPVTREPIPPRAPLRPTEAPVRPASETEHRPAATPTAEENLAEMAQRLEAALRRPSSSPSTAPQAPGASPAPAAPPATAEGTRPASPTPAKGAFENLEDEMASLLGRPKSPS